MKLGFTAFLSAYEDLLDVCADIHRDGLKKELASSREKPAEVFPLRSTKSLI